MKNLKEFEGMTNLSEIEKQIEICRTFCIDHRFRRGLHKETLERFHPEKITYTVTDISEDASDAKTFRLSPVNGYLPPFRPGQYINLDMEINGIQTSRAYTISSTPTQRAFYEITIKRTFPGFASTYMLEHIKIGDTLTSSGPVGSFYRIPAVHGKRLVLIAGGSGITPFLSMLLTDYAKQDTSYDIDLIYGCATTKDILFKQELDTLAEKDICRVHYILSNSTEECNYRKGFITADLLKEIAGDPSQCTFYLCGPTAMYEFVTQELHQLGVPRRSIRNEVQVPPNDPTRFPNWPTGVDSQTFYTITLADGRSITACATQTIIQALENANIIIPNLCRSGECSACRTKLIEGKVFHPNSELLRKSDMHLGYIHPCVTYPITDLRLDL